MMFLFGMECKKIAKSILYWVLVLALLAVSFFQYEPAVESELQRTNDPASVFYTTSSGSYAEERSGVPDEAMERAMMTGATNRLISNYRSNSYEYYPFGYVKEKTMSPQEQAVILQYLMELTGLSEQALNGTAGGTGDTNIGDIPISGDGAFILEPGDGSTNENGQFVIEPDDWQYVPNNGTSPETPETPSGGIENTPASGNNEAAPTPNLNTENEQPQTTQEENQPTEGDVAPPPSETPEYSDGDIGDIPISGPGAFILEPGQGSVNEGGQFVITPDDWQYVEKTASRSGKSNENGSSYAVRLSTLKSVENDGTSSETASRSNASFEIQVSFERFKEIMAEVNGLIGRNSYFSWTMLTLYYFGNDMEDTPITERQHLEFYEGDQVTGAFARYYCDSISLVVLFLPAFVIVDLMLRDKRRKMQGLTYPRTISSAKVICTRYTAAVCMTMLPILILPVKSLVVLMRYCGSIGVSADALAFVKYTLTWILPTVLLIMAISLLVTALLENYTAILLTGLIWLIGRPSVDKLAGGNYDLFDLIIRHNTLKGYGRMMENIQMLAMNRVTISVAALALVGLTVLVYSMKRKGGLTFGGQKSAHNHRFKLSSEL